jgi:pimeloyl-ACP methyl ester carboxylesterase
MGAVAVIVAPDEDLSDDDLASLLASSAAPAGAKVVRADGGGRAARESRQAARDASGRVSASPAARKRAGELGIDLATVDATGPNGRVTSEDIERAYAASLEAAAAPQAVMVALDNGLQISALQAGPHDAPETLLFVHGLGGSQSTWAAVLGNFAETYRVAAIDLLGHGASDKPAPEATDYSIAGLSAAVGEVIEKLELAPVVVIGHSLGGAAALQLALDRPKLVRGLVLIDGAGLGPEINSELLDRIESEPSREEARALMELFFANQRFILDRGIDDMYASRQAEGADAAVKAIAAGVFSRTGQQISYVDRLGEVEAPVLLVWGELDRVFPAKQAVAASKALPTSWLEVFEGIGHVPHVEAAPAFTALVKRWLLSLPRP